MKMISSGLKTLTVDSVIENWELGHLRRLGTAHTYGLAF
jgi:hypothetical protein